MDGGIPAVAAHRRRVTRAAARCQAMGILEVAALCLVAATRRAVHTTEVTNASIGSRKLPFPGVFQQTTCEQGSAILHQSLLWSSILHQLYERWPIWKWFELTNTYRQLSNEAHVYPV